MFKLFGSKTAKPSASPEVIAKLEQARALAGQGQLAEAALICREILSVQLDHVDSLMLCAEIATRERDPERAIELYTRIEGLARNHAPAHYKHGNVLKDCGRLEAAVASYDRAIAIDPGHAAALCNRGTVLERLNRLEEALASYDQAVARDPADAFSHGNRGNLLLRLGRSAEALASYDKAIAAKPDYTDAHFNRGSLLKGLGRWQEARESYDKVIEMAPGFPPAYLHRGAVLRELKQNDAALASYDKAIAIDPRFSEAYKYRGALLHETGQSEAAVVSYSKAIELDPGNAEAYYNRGLIFQEKKQSAEAMADYERAIALIPHFAEAHSNRGGLFYVKKQFELALACYDKAIALDPNYIEAWWSRGIVLKDLSRWDAALASFDRAIALSPDCAVAHENRGAILGRLRRHTEAIASYDRLAELRPEASTLQRTYIKMWACDWRNLPADISRTTADILNDRPLLSGPLPITALLDEPALHRRAAEICVREECPSDDSLGAIPPRLRGEKIRLGYYSPDFRVHSVARLTAELFEIHDRSRFEVIAFAFGPEASDPMRKRLEQAFDRFIDVRNQTDLEVAALSRELKIDIAIDLAGFTEHCRPKIFALRAAPVQLSYIGYLGTMGAPYMDYLVADDTIIPPARRDDYSEKIIYLPCYQVNDSRRTMSKREFTRNELGLPPEGFIFSCLNSIYKVQPSTFDAWMRILQRVPDSKLFLCPSNATAERNLLTEAEHRGIAPQRFVFGKHIEVDDYLARFAAMDLFLDTWPYNGGTTVSDALWTGLPVLTYQGQSFASRSAASLLQAIGLPELITASPQAYEDLSVELAMDPARLEAIRRKLVDSRRTAALFDTRSFTKHLEAAYENIWERSLGGLPPEHIHA